jgi:hypothetical protein
MHKVALAFPCLLAEETAHPRFTRRIPQVGSIVLTINTGFE